MKAVEIFEGFYLALKPFTIFLQATEVKAKTEAKAKVAAAKTGSKAATMSNKVSAVKDKAMGMLHPSLAIQSFAYQIIDDCIPLLI